MGWFRKSKKIGGVRLTLSKRGLTTSIFGVRLKAPPRSRASSRSVPVTPRPVHVGSSLAPIWITLGIGLFVIVGGAIDKCTKPPAPRAIPLAAPAPVWIPPPVDAGYDAGFDAGHHRHHRRERSR
jgi:hypothetical protein